MVCTHFDFDLDDLLGWMRRGLRDPLSHILLARQDGEWRGMSVWTEHTDPPFNADPWWQVGYAPCNPAVRDALVHAMIDGMREAGFHKIQAMNGSKLSDFDYSTRFPGLIGLPRNRVIDFRIDGEVH